MSSVKKIPRKTAPSTGLENRGARPTGVERRDRAQNYWFDKIQKFMERNQELEATDPTGKRIGNLGKKSLRKQAAVKKEATRKIINSNPVKSGSTRIGPLSGPGGSGRGRGGAGGGGILGSKIR